MFLNFSNNLYYNNVQSIRYLFDNIFLNINTIYNIVVYRIQQMNSWAHN